MDEVVVPEVVHSGRQVAEHEQPLVLVESEVVLGVVEEVEEGSACGMISPYCLFLKFTRG